MSVYTHERGGVTIGKAFALHEEGREFEYRPR
jgi:hypothetical protein